MKQIFFISLEMNEKLSVFVKIFVITICYNLILCDVESENILRDERSLIPELSDKPGRKPPRFGKRGLFVLLSTRAIDNRLANVDRQESIQRDFGRDIASNERDSSPFQRPNYDNKYVLWHSNHNK